MLLVLLVSKPAAAEVLVESFEPAFGDRSTSFYCPVGCNLSSYRVLHFEAEDTYTYSDTDTVTSWYARQGVEREDVMSLKS